MENKQLRIVIGVALQDAGEATRALEIACGIRDFCPAGWSVDIIFLSHGSLFAHMITDAGFTIYDCSPRFHGRNFREDLKTQFPELAGDVSIARDVILGERAALQELKPDLVIYGFWPFTNIARRMQGIPGICFLPLPLHQSVVGSALLQDVPDTIKPLTSLPLAVRRTLVKLIPARVKTNAPGFRQRYICRAAEAASWTGPPLNNLFDLLQADLTLVIDLPEFYVSATLPANFRITGPLYASAASETPLDPAILRLFDPAERRPKIFCTMGSSGIKEHLLAAITALTSGKGTAWNSVILVPPTICPLEEALAHAGDHPHVYLTDAFVPAPRVNALADIVVCHGGQGTVQTALASGTPLVGVAMQMEQQINLDHLVVAGTAIRIPIHRWQPAAIQAAVERIITHLSYREKARRLQQRINSMDGRKEIALRIWKFVLG
ncbi:MAG: glycosyl transferase [Ktedonobacteraceae bacterium]|nr:glycosyl transferase [Ktedonobacteraceae bacterium]